MNKPIFALPVATLAVALLAGCGDEKSTDSVTNDPNNPNNGGGNAAAQTTSFGGSLFSGMRYFSDAATIRGVVDAEGRFEYLDNESLYFSVGNIDIVRVEPEHVDTWFITAHDTELTENHGVIKTVLADSITSGFDKLANKMAFLSALDNDQDASNGFNLAEWSPKLMDESINFELPYHQFVSTELAAFQQRNSLPVTVSTHGLEGLYEILSVDIRDYVVDSKTVTEQGPKGVLIKTHDYSLNENGQITREVLQKDTQADGTIDRIETREFSYNTNGRQTAYILSTDTNADGVEDARSEYDYGWTATDKRLFTEVRDDSNGDSEFEQVTRLDWIYNEFDDIEKETSTFTRYHSGSSTVDTTALNYFYSRRNPRQLNKTISVTDNTTDGSIESKITVFYEYDENGNQTLKSTSVDSDNSGVPDQIYEVIERYNTNNQVIFRRFENDYDGDSVLDNVYEEQFTYTNGLLTQDKTFKDGNNNGTVDWLLQRDYEHDEDGELSKRIERYDTNLDGSFETHFSTTFDKTIDFNGAVIAKLEVIDVGDNGSNDARNVISTDYEDMFGLPTKIVNGRDFNLDGQFNRSETMENEYDEQWNVGIQTVISVFETTETVTTEYTYEAIPTTLNISTWRR